MDQNCFIIRPLNPQDLIDNENREISKKRIEMIPFDRPNFEFISFIDFANITEYDYFVFRVDPQKNKSIHIEMYKRQITTYHPSTSNYYFFVHINQNFSEIKIFMKNHINTFTFERIDMIPCLKFSLSKISKNKVDFKKLHSQPLNDSLLYHVSKYFLKNDDKCPECILNYFINTMNSTKTSFNTVSISSIKTILDVLQPCPGFIDIVYQNESKLNPTNEREIQTLTIIFPWAVTALQLIHYLELDGSFDGMKPYVYCVVQGVSFNESIPIAITVAPTECLSLYQNFFDEINELTNDETPWEKFVVVSDMHPSIKSICQTLKITQYFCHRHLIQHFGSSSSLGIFANKLLKCFSLEQYLHVSKDVIDNLNEFEKERSKIGPINKDLQLKIDEIRIMASFEDGDHNSDYYYQRWALWIRRGHHVGRCSNHNEALHGVINRSLNSTYGLPKKLFNLIDVILRHFIYLKKRCGKSIKRKLNDYVQNVLKKLEDPAFDIFYYCNENCFCQEDLYNEMIYGASIPCRHQLLLKAKKTLKFVDEKLKLLKSISINHLVREILKKCIIQNEINEKHIQFYFNTMKLQLEEKKFNIEYDEFLHLFRDIESCFIFDTPPVPNIELNWNIHLLKEHNSKDYLEFKKDESKDTFKLNEVCDENFISIEEDQSEAVKKAKRILFETIYEIISVYPQLNKSSLAYSICFDKYLKFISFLNDDEIYKWLPPFKIACWKAADLKMGKNKFFK